MAPKKSSTTKATTKAVKASKTTKAKATKKAAVVAVGKKKKDTSGSDLVDLQPFKGWKYCFADFKDKELAAKIVKFGGTMTTSVKQADYVISEDLNSDKYYEAVGLNKDTKSKEDLEFQIEEFEDVGADDGKEDAHEVHVSVGKKKYTFRAPWFNKLGTVNTKSTDPFFAANEHPGTLALVDDYDIALIDGDDSFAFVYRFQLVQDVDTKAYYLDQRTPILQHLVSGDISGMRCFEAMDSKEAGIKAFEELFKEKVGFVWKNRHTGKPKKGCCNIIQFA